MALLEHLVLEIRVVDWQLSVLQDEFLHHVAVVCVDRKDLDKAEEDFALDSVLGVDEGRELLREVDRLIDGHLCSFFLVLLEEECESVDDLGPGGPRGKELIADERVIVLAKLGQEVMKGLDGARSEHLVENRDFSQELSRDFFETAWELGNVRQSHLQVVPKIGIVGVLEPRNDGLNDDGVLFLVYLVNDLVLSIQVDRRAHQNEGGVESVLVAPFVRRGQVDEARRDDLVVDALLLPCVVDAHVANDSQTELCNLRELVLKLFLCEVLSNDLIELLDGVTAQKRFNSTVAKCDVDESLKEVDQVLSILILDLFWLRVADE